MTSTTTQSVRLALSIDGMSCEHCVQAVTRALAAVPSVRVRSIALGSAEIEAADAGAADAAIAALADAGYPARVTGRVAASSAATPRGRTGGCCCGPKGCGD